MSNVFIDAHVLGTLRRSVRCLEDEGHRNALCSVFDPLVNEHMKLGLLSNDEYPSADYNQLARVHPESLNMNY